MSKAEDMCEASLKYKDDNGNYIIGEETYFEMTEYAEKLEQEVADLKSNLEDLRKI